MDDYKLLKKASDSRSWHITAVSPYYSI